MVKMKKNLYLCVISQVSAVLAFIKDYGPLSQYFHLISQILLASG